MYQIPSWSESISSNNPVVYFDIEVISSNKTITQLGRIEMTLAADVVPIT